MAQPVTAAMASAMPTPATSPIVTARTGDWSGCQSGGATAKKTARPTSQLRAVAGIHHVAPESDAAQRRCSLVLNESAHSWACSL